MLDLSKANSFFTNHKYRLTATGCQGVSETALDYTDRCLLSHYDRQLIKPDIIKLTKTPIVHSH